MTGNHDDRVTDTLLAAMRYIVRRLTPTECERLMGLPDGYTIPVGLDPNDPALVAEFQRIFDEFGAIMAAYEGGRHYMNDGKHYKVEGPHGRKRHKKRLGKRAKRKRKRKAVRHD